MREIFTDKNFKTSKILLLSKIILVIALFIFFLPLFVLPFFNHPFADDYISGYYVNHKPFLDYQQFVYTSWGGRFAATFTGALFAKNYFFYKHYYFHSLLLLLLDFTTLVFLVRTVCKYVLQESASISKNILYAILLLALQICCVPEISTFLFWFSSAITYFMPVILLQVEIALLVIFFYTEKKALRTLCHILLPLLVFTTIGFNELFVIVQLFLFFIAWHFKLYKKCSAMFIIVILIAFVAATVLLFLSPGISIRRSEINSKNLGLGMVAIGYQSAEALWNIFKTPLLWITAAAVFLYADKTKSKWKNNFTLQELLRKKWIIAIYVLAFLVAAVALPVVALKGGVIPERYLNAIVCILLVCIIILCFAAGVSGNSKTVFFPSYIKIIINFFLAVGLLANVYITNAYKSLIIAPAYNAILNERENLLKLTATQHKNAVIKDYNAALTQLIQTKYSSAPITLQQLLTNKPPLLFFEDDLETNNSIGVLKRYYDVDSILVQNK